MLEKNLLENFGKENVVLVNPLVRENSRIIFILEWWEMAEKEAEKLLLPLNIFLNNSVSVFF